MASSRNLRERTVWGLLWAGIGQFGSQGIRYVVLLILALLLEPVDFGLLGVAMVFIVFAEAISELGLASAIIQTEDTSAAIRSTAFWANLLIGILLFGVTIQIAQPLSIFLGDERAAELLPYLALIFPIRAISIIPLALLTREMDFKALASREFVAQIAYGIVGCALALADWGVWALVAAVVVERAASTAMLWFAVDWRPALLFQWSKLRALAKFGSFAMASALLNTGLSNVDYFIIGRYLGPEALGYYTLAFQIAVVSQRRLIGIFRRVAFPALVEIQHEPGRLRESFHNAIGYVYVILAPLSMLIASLAPLFVSTTYSTKWAAAVLPMQILTLAALAYGFDLSESFYFAKGRPVLRVMVIGVRIGVFILLSIPLRQAAGVVGVASALAAAAAISMLLNILFVRRLVDISLRTVGHSIFAPFVSALIAAGPIWLISTFLAPYGNSVVVIILAACAGIIVYVVALMLLSPYFRMRARADFERLRTTFGKSHVAK